MPYTLWKDIEEKIAKFQPENKNDLEHTINLLNYITNKLKTHHKIYYETENLKVRHLYLSNLTEEIINGNYEKNDRKWSILPTQNDTIRNKEKKQTKKKRKRTNDDESNNKFVKKVKQPEYLSNTDVSSSEEFTESIQTKSKRKD
jgi:hypothetical protein